MKIPIYILGFLKRYGSLHGYKLKGLIAEMVSDFTQIKLPAIYYHLEKLEEKGLVSSEKEQEGKRPERSVYSITEKGKEEFSGMLAESLDYHYRPEFDIDSALYFFDSVDADMIISALKKHESYCGEVLEFLEKHREETLDSLPEEGKKVADVLFNHHTAHYTAELGWLNTTVKLLNKLKLK